MITGLKITLLIAAVTTVTSLCLGTVIAVMRLSKFRVLRGLGRLYVEIFRNIPGIFWLLFFYFVFPEILPFGIGEKLNAYIYYPIVAGILGLTFDNSAYVSDIVRSGILAVPKGQKEAATSTGLNDLQQWMFITLPQTFRIILPPLGTRMIHNLKNTSLCMIIAAPELTWATQQIESITFRGLEATTVATIFYICFSLSLAAIIITLERYLKIDIESITRMKT